MKTRKAQAIKVPKHITTILWESLMWAAYTLSHIKRTLVYKNYKFQQVSKRHD